MSLEEAIYLAVQGDAGVAAIVGDKVYPGESPQNTALPFVVFTRIATAAMNVHDGRSALDDVTVQFSCFAATYAGVHDLAAAVRLSVENVAIDTGVRGIFQNASDIGTDKTFFGRGLDFSFIVQP